jgi:hypothetical protein
MKQNGSSCLRWSAVGFALVVLITAASCGHASSGGAAGAAAVAKNTKATYDKDTGKLTLLTAEMFKCGKVDTWTYMDGPKIVRTESDRDCDGKIDQWEYYGPNGKVSRVALSRNKTGKPDAWAYPDAAGQVARIEVSSVGDERHIDSWEYYEHGVLVRAEFDTNHDGRPDKWETYEGEVLKSVEFDQHFSGIRDKRLTYSPPGVLALIESDPDGHGGYKQRQVIK